MTGRGPRATRARRLLASRSVRVGLLPAALLSWLAVFPTPPARAQDARELEALRGRIESLRKEIAEAEETRSEARDQLRDSERAISESNRALRGLTQRRDRVRGEIARLAAQRAAAESKATGGRDQLGRLLAAWYRGGEPGPLKLLLSGEDPNRTAREMHYLGHVSRAQAALIEQLREAAAQLAALEIEARDKASELAQVEREQRSERDVLVAQQNTRRKVLERVSAQLRDQRRQVKSLERDETRLARLVEKLTQALAAAPPRRVRPAPAETPAKPAPGGRRNELVPERGGARAEAPFAGLKGALRLPVRGSLANRFGASRQGGGPSWKGLFIRAASGEEVRAVAPGRVVFSDWMRGFGNLLILDHGQGYLSIYGNNESVLKSVGDEVLTGEPVATVGTSGGNEESGLYFELRHQGRAFDPMSWVRLR